MSKKHSSPTNFLRQWRLQGHPSGKKLTLEQLANILGISTSVLSEKERGIRPVDIELLENMADEFSCEPWMLLMAPPGSPELEAMKKARDLLLTMDSNQREAWFLLGERIKKV